MNIKGNVILEDKVEEPKPQTSSSGSFGGRKGKAPPHTPYKKRPHKVGDRVITPNKQMGVIIRIRSNGQIDYLVNIPKVGQRWYSDREII